MNFYRYFLKIVTPLFLFVLVLNLARVWLVPGLSYIYLNWNLFLALLPIGFLWLFEHKSKNKVLSTIFFLGWLLFLPNAPYIITDFIHLRDVGLDSMLWYDGFMIFGYAVMGIMAFVFSLNRMTLFFKRPHLFIFGISLLSSFGIYLGRYIRWNTWNIITHPLQFFKNVFEILGGMFQNSLLLLTIAVFTLGMMAFVYAYRNFLKK